MYVFTASEVKDDTILSSILKLYPYIEGDPIDGKTYYSNRPLFTISRWFEALRVRLSIAIHQD